MRDLNDLEVQSLLRGSKRLDELELMALNSGSGKSA